MEFYYVLLSCLLVFVVPSLQYDDRTMSLKEASLIRLAKRQRGSGRLRIDGEFFGRNGGSLQGSLHRDTLNTRDFFRGRRNRARTDAAFEARLPSGAGVGGRANFRRSMNAGLLGVSGRMTGNMEGGINDAFGNHFGGNFGGSVGGRVGLPVIDARYVAVGNTHRHYGY